MRIDIEKLKIDTSGGDNNGHHQKPKQDYIMLCIAIIGLLLAILTYLGIKIHFGL